MRLLLISNSTQHGRGYLDHCADTNLACPTIMTTNDMPIVYPPSFEALDLVPFQINPHYLDPDPDSYHQGETRERRIQEFHEVNDLPVLGLREGSWVFRKDVELRLEGETPARLFRRGQPPQEHPTGSDLSFLLAARARRP